MSLSRYILMMIAITDIASLTGYRQGDSSLKKLAWDIPKQRVGELQDSSTRQGSIHQNDEIVKENLKRDRFPPKSPSSSSISMEEMLSRAETILQALRNEGCPDTEENIFNITVYTADLRLAGTTSRVYINLYGTIYGLEKSTEKIHLTNNDKSEFTRGGVDSFVVKINFVGLVRRVTIEHDNTGFFPDWNLQKIVVHDLKLGTVQTFMCDCELAGYENQVSLPPT